MQGRTISKKSTLRVNISCQQLNTASELETNKIPNGAGDDIWRRREEGAALMCMKQSGIDVLLISSSLLYEDAHQRQPRAWVHT
jgi:hypothetical protein